MKKYIIKTLGLKGSWKWAKKQMLSGEHIRRESWLNSRRLRIDNEENGLLQTSLYWQYELIVDGEPRWKPAMHHLKSEDHTDYVIFEW